MGSGFLFSGENNGEPTAVHLPTLFTPLDTTPSKGTPSLSEVRLHFVESPAQEGAMILTRKEVAAMKAVAREMKSLSQRRPRKAKAAR